jgi:hypothetical protein
MKTKHLLLLVMMLSAFHRIYAQDQTRYERQEAAGKIIDAELKSLYGPSYYGAPFVDEVDSNLGSNSYFINPLDDPYGTLEGCFIFVGSRDMSISRDIIVGVYKEGNILWHSDTLNCYSRLRLFTTQDLNNDGTVDLVFESGNDNTELWIFSWNGHMGRQINAVDENGASLLKGYNYRGSGSFGLIDIEGDGIWEIEVYNYNEGEPNGYSWNGQEYGHWPNTPDINIMFPPRNKIDININCHVTKQSDTLQFSYEVFNKPTSKQRVEFFRIWCDVQDVVGFPAPAYWGFSHKAGKGFGWMTWISNVSGHIRVGKSLDGFRIKAKSLCGILSFFAHGHNGVGQSSNLPHDLEKLKLTVKDQLENAFYGITIGPANPSDPFVPLVFLDTLLSYTRQSVQLGWLIEKNAEKRIDNKIELAKKLLQMAENCTSNLKQTDLLNEAKKAVKEDEIVLRKEYGNDALQGLSRPPIEENEELNQYEKELSKKKPDEAKCKELCKKIHTWLAIKTLQSLVYEVEMLNRLSEKGKRQYLKSEAYALLKYNTEYLIEQLKKK